MGFFDNEIMNTMPRYYVRIYLASSWRNTLQPTIVDYLRKLGFTGVYDFKNPPNGSAFSWKEVDSNYVHGKKIDADEYRRLLASPEAERGYASDIKALK